MKNKCSITRLPIEGWSDAIWDEGEWISWAHINDQIHDQAEKAILDRMVQLAKDYFNLTGRHLPIYGEIGELYAACRFGIVRHKSRAKGSDGRMGDDFVEVKTITPQKGNFTVSVKRSGNFNKLVIVKINPDFRMDARMVDRSQLPKGDGKYYRVSWASVKLKAA